MSVIIPQASHQSSSCDPNFIGLVNIWYHDEYIRITTITITVNCYDSDVYTIISNIGLIQNNFHEHILEHVWDFKERFVQYLLELCRKLMSIFIHTIWHNTIQIVEKKVWTIQIYLLPHISIFQTQINKFTNEAINLGYGKKNLIHTRNIGEKPRGHVIGGDDVLVLEPF
jgi:hypothetical protein